MNNIPDWWQLLLLATAAWRTFRLLAQDTILNRPRRYLLRLGDWQEDDGEDNLPASYREELGLFITCPYCAGFWISLAWWAAWLVWPHATLFITVPLVINTLVIGISKLDTDE